MAYVPPHMRGGIGSGGGKGKGKGGGEDCGGGVCGFVDRGAGSGFNDRGSDRSGGGRGSKCLAPSGEEVFDLVELATRAGHSLPRDGGAASVCGRFQLVRDEDGAVWLEPDYKQHAIHSGAYNWKNSRFTGDRTPLFLRITGAPVLTEASIKEWLASHVHGHAPELSRLFGWSEGTALSEVTRRVRMSHRFLQDEPNGVLAIIGQREALARLCMSAELELGVADATGTGHSDSATLLAPMPLGQALELAQKHASEDTVEAILRPHLKQRGLTLDLRSKSTMACGCSPAAGYGGRRWRRRTVRRPM